VVIDCSAVPDNLMESELFGHERGAFTGASERRVGCMEEADGGTLFLDELGELPLPLQAKLLRAIENREFRPVGAQQRRTVDVRFVAATNRDLAARVNDGGFREDLYYRLAVLRVVVPPLRERLDDIPLLVDHFAAEFSRENNRRPARFSPGAIEALGQARWRGNIRELRNVIERLLIMTDRAVIEAADVKAVTRPDGRPSAPAAAAALPAQAMTLREFKEWSERAFLVEKLREFGWNISRTAEVIDTPRSNLYKKLEQYAITQESDG